MNRYRTLVVNINVLCMTVVLKCTLYIYLMFLNVFLFVLFINLVLIFRKTLII